VKPVAITGIGVLSPIGRSGALCLESLRAGRGGLGPSADRGLRRMGVCGVGAVAAATADGLDRVEHLAVTAARQALADARLAASELPERTWLCVSTSKGAVNALEAQLADRAAPRLPMERFAPDAAVLAVARELGIRGPAGCLPAACATGLVSVLAAAREVASGRAELAIAGASESSLTPFIHAGFLAMGALAGGAGLDPQRAVRPFDEARRGFLLAEGAAVFVLEARERAERRGAPIRALLAGGAQVGEAHDPVAPEPRGDGPFRAARLALERAGLGPEDLDGLWLHGTATRAGDQAELAGLARLLAGVGRAVPATATKGLTGHLLGASGAVELAFAALCLGAGWLPAVANLETPMAGAAGAGIGLVRGQALGLAARRLLVLSAGFGGHAAAAVVERGG
jgi:3-oxoacyl-[acyl-carrier-protein] synthase II